LTALTYALTFVPALLGGAVLAGLADRFPRRAVLIVADLVRAVLAGVLALPGVPMVVLWAAVFALAVAAAPFKAAQLALLPTVLEGERYKVGLSVRTVSAQFAQLAGFAGGGAVLLLVAPEVVLGANAATFVVSALIIRIGALRRPATRAHGRGQADRSAVRLVMGDRRVLALVGFTVLAGMTVAPEGVAAPYAAELSASALAVGLLLAADPLGSALGGWVLSRWPSVADRTNAMTVLAILSGIALVPCFLRPGVPLSVVLWGMSGAFTTMCLIQAQSVLTLAVPDSRRAAVVGLASAGLQTSQGLVILFAGALGDQIGVYRAVGVVGVLTAVLAVLCGLLWRRARPRSRHGFQDGHEAGHGTTEERVTGHGCALPAPPPPDRATPNETRSR
jgi:MFS family permease